MRSPLVETHPVEQQLAEAAAKEMDKEWGRSKGKNGIGFLGKRGSREITE